MITYIINNDQAANKGYVDGNFVTKNCATFSGVVITNQGPKGGVPGALEP